MMSRMFRGVQKYVDSLGVRGLSAAVKGMIVDKPTLFTVTRSDLKAPLVLRLPTADFPTYRQVMVDCEYDFVATNPPSTIVDGGAHIGLASVWFANRFPEATIIAVEPEAENFALLERNVASYPNVQPVQAALWNTDTTVDIVDAGLGTYGFMTRSRDEVSPERKHHCVRAITIDRLLEERGIGHVDVLKLDVEGAERELFATPGAWLDRTDLIVVELHERLKVGCERAFYGATEAFTERWSRGELVYVARRGTGFSAAQADAPSRRIH